MKNLVLFILAIACSALSFSQTLSSDGKYHIRVAGSGNNYTILLSRNIPSLVFDVPFQGAIVALTFTQDNIGGHTVVFDPSTIVNSCSISTLANATTVCEYYYDGAVNQWFTFTLASTVVNNIQNFAGVNPSSFNWTQSPSGSLTTPGNQTITLTPVPAGIDATDTWTYVYIAGTGTPEYALITGGTAVSGSPSGTITVTTVNSHSAGYTIGSASQGWQEASNGARFVPGNPTIAAQGGIVVATPGTEYSWGAPVTVHSSFQVLNFSGSIVDCNMAASCLFIGDANPTAISNVAVTNFRGRPGVTNGTGAMIEDSAQGVTLDGVYFRAPVSTQTFGYMVQFDNDQNAHILHVDTNASIPPIRCDASFCGTVIYAPGPFATNAGVIRIDHSNLYLNCKGNGIDDQQGNTLHISDVVVQVWSQFAIRNSLASGGSGPLQMDNVYEEAGSCSNPSYSGSIAANTGLILNGGRAFIRGGEFASAVMPTFTGGTGSGTTLNFFIVAHDSILGASNALPIGTSVNTAGTITIQWPKVAGTNTITYDGIETPGNPLGGGTVPSGSLAGGSTGTGSGSVFTNMAQCAGSICSTTVNLASALSAYSVPTIAYAPLLTFWPGGVVLSQKVDVAAASAASVNAFLDTTSNTFFSAPLISEITSIPSIYTTDCISAVPPQVNTQIACMANIRSLASDPATCSPTDANGGNNIYYNTTSSSYKFCSATNTWSAFGGGSAAFSSLTTGTNTSATMTVGTGASMTTSGSGSITATSVPYSGVTSGANSVAKTETTSGSLVPAQTAVTNAQGQISSNQLWTAAAAAAIYPPQPTMTISQTGGSLSAGLFFVVVTFVGPSVIVPSAEIRDVAAGGATHLLQPCTGNTCQVTINMPTQCTAGNLPSGVTGCTVWDSLTSGTELQQAASSACVNITTATCVINVRAAGAALVWPSTTGVTPPSYTAGPNPPPDHIIPSLFFQKGDGNTYPLGGVDLSALNVLPQPAGTFTISDRLFFNDTGNPPPISNSLVSIHHNSGVTTSTCSTSNCATGGIDDRGFSIHVNDSTTAPFYEQFLGEYVEAYFSQANFQCNPLGQEDCAAGVRGTTADFRPANSGTTTIGAPIAGVSGLGARSTSGTSNFGSCKPCYVGVKGAAINQQAGSLNGDYFAGVLAQYSNFTGGTTGNGADFYAFGAVTKFDQENVAYLVNSTNYAAATGVYAFDSRGTAQERHEGLMALGGGITADNATLAITGSVPITGSLNTIQMGTPSITTIVPANPGGVTCKYQVVAVDNNGGTSPASAQISSSACNANLTATNTVTLTVHQNSSPGAASYKLYRVVEGSNCNGVLCTNGLIITTPVSQNFLFTPGNTPDITFVDTGQVGDGNTTPSTTLNYTGSISAPLYNTATNCSAIGTAANPSVASCTAASAGSFSCATNASTGTCVVNTTAVTANSEIFVQQRADTTTGTRLGVTCNTGVTTVTPVITAVSAGVSFTINLGTVTTNPECFSYRIIN